MQIERQRPQAPTFVRALFWLVILMIFAPLVSVVIFAFRDNSEWTPKWFLQVFQEPTVIAALTHSLLIAVVSSLLSVALGTAASLALRGHGFRAKKTLNTLSFVSLLMPEIVFALSLLTWFSLIGLQLGYLTIVIAHVTFTISYVILTVNSRLLQVDPQLEDAARDLGANEWTILKSILLPLIAPSMLSGFILSFLLSFDDFLITFFVSGVSSQTLPVKLYTSLRAGVTPQLNALACLMWLLSLVFMILALNMKSFHHSMTGEKDES